MTLRLPHFRLRTLLVAVAIAGLACGLGERHLRFKRLADNHRAFRGWALLSSRHMMYVDGSQKLVSGERMGWRQVLAEKYERAARYPWLPVAPDPPEPE